MTGIKAASKEPVERSVLEAMPPEDGGAFVSSPVTEAETGLLLPQWRRLTIFALLLTSEFLYGWAWNTVDVLRPFLRQSLHLSLLQAGSAYSAQGAGALTGAIVIGQLADRFGRRNALAMLIVGYGLMLMAGVFVASYPELLLQRVLLGFFLGAEFPVGVGIYCNLFSDRVRGRLAAVLNGSFSTAIVLLGVALSFLGSHDWRLLLWIGAIPPFGLAILVMLIVPNIKSSGAGKAKERFPISGLFAPALRQRTLLLATMTGLNFFGYQAYSGWLTTYLTTVRGLSPAVSGNLVAWQFAGNIFGGLLWGWAADRFGRRFNALGFFIAAAAIVTFILAPTNLMLLRFIGLVYGGTLCSSVIWGPWIAELYPLHLRSTAASIFNWGRVISFFSPLITAGIAGRFGLAAAMLAGSMSFGVAALIWLSQPETLRRSPVLA